MNCNSCEVKRLIVLRIAIHDIERHEIEEADQPGCGETEPPAEMDENDSYQRNADPGSELSRRIKKEVAKLRSCRGNQ